MEIIELIRKLDEEAPGAVLETRPFGRTVKKSVWIEMRSIQRVAKILRQAPFHFDWLESISVVEIDEALVFTYFLRSTVTGELLVVRGSVVPPSPEERVDVLSVQQQWPMAAQQELELSDLFGIRFEGVEKTGSILPDGSAPQGL